MLISNKRRKPPSASDYFNDWVRRKYLLGKWLDLQGKKILQNLPEETAALARQKYSKTDINAFVESAVNIASIIKKRTLQIPYLSYWGLEKPKFFLGITTDGLDEFIYAWAKLML